MASISIPAVSLLAVTRQNVFFALAVLATLATLALLVVTILSERRPRAGRQPQPRGRRGGPARDPREALALVGDTLAATHNPSALLPVILRATVDATGAAGGRLLVGEEEAAQVGAIAPGVAPLALELDEREGVSTTMLLYPAEGGFDVEARRLAEWLASQAAIALENARLHHVVQRQAATDDLTGLVNRRRFLAALTTEIARETRVAPPSLILADLDDFKHVNDRYGHPLGDEVLQAFARALVAHVRDVDVAARLGGEEFAVLLPETSLEGATAVAERLQRSLAGGPLLEHAGEGVGATASFGVAQLVEGEALEELLRRADAALYRAKAEGKNRVVAAALPRAHRPDPPQYSHS